MKDPFNDIGKKMPYRESEKYLDNLIDQATEGAIGRQLVSFSIPVALGLLFQQLYGTVDSIVVGNYVGANALGSITGTAVVTWALISLLMGISSGAGVSVAQDFGARDDEGLSRSVHTTVVAIALFSVVFAVLGWLLAIPLLGFLRLDADLVEDAALYLRIFCVGIPGMSLYNAGTGILRAVGDSRRPLWILIGSSVLNVGLDLLFVLVFDWKVAGVAWATVISEYLSAVVTLGLLFVTKGPERLHWRQMRIDAAKLKKIVAIGIPTGVQMGIISFSNVFVQSYINAFGPDATTGWGIVFRIDGFVVIPVQSLSTAIVTFVGQNAGAHNLARIRAGVSTCMKMALACTVVLSATEVLAAGPLVSLFNQEEGVIAYGVLFMWLTCVFDFVTVPSNVHECALAGVGQTRVPMVICIGSYVVLRQIYLAIVSHLTDSVIPIALGYPLGWVACSIVMWAFYRRSKAFLKYGVATEGEGAQAGQE